MKLVIDQNKINSICDKTNIVYLGIFGSQVNGDATENSDVDLLVDFAETQSLFELARIHEKFEELFNKKVDLVQRKNLKKLLRSSIQTSVHTLYGKE